MQLPCLYELEEKQQQKRIEEIKTTPYIGNVPKIKTLPKYNIPDASHESSLSHLQTEDTGRKASWSSATFVFDATFRQHY